MHLKNLILIIALHFICGSTFAQEPVIVPKPKETVENQGPVIYDVVDEPADFPGGSAALKKYIADNLKYPDTAKENGLEGKCYLQFIVSLDGHVSNVKLKKGVPNCPECDKEAIRIVKSMPKWTPGKINGKAVNSIYTLPVLFKL
jgi:periplasmic protein TonB